MDHLVNEKGYFGTVRHLINNGDYGLLLYGIRTFTMRRYAARFGLINLTMEKGSTLILSLLNELTLNEPFILLINIMEAHNPYVNIQFWDNFILRAFYRAVFENSLDEKTVNIWRRKYPKHAEYAVDRALNIVHVHSRYLDDTLFIITSDHGELLGDGGIHHGYFLRDSLLRVPLWVKWPNWFKAPRQVKPFVSLTEVPLMIRAVLNNDEDYEVGSSIVLSESFGSTLLSTYESRYRKLSPETLTKVFSHKIRIYTDKCVFTYNMSMDSIEKRNCEEAMVRNIVEVIRH